MERAGRATTVAVADCLSHRRRRRRRRWSSTDYVRSRPLSLFPPYSVPRYRVAGRRYCSTAERTDGEREGPDTRTRHSLTRAYLTSRYTNCGIQRAWNAVRTWNNASRRRPSADMQAALPCHSSISYERDGRRSSNPTFPDAAKDFLGQRWFLLSNRSI